jgi:hypothetical protein
VAEAVVVCGHTHAQFDRRLGPWRVVNAGAVGLPYWGRAGAYWLLLGPDVEHRRTDYDLDRAIAAMRTGGNPDTDQLLSESLLKPRDPAQLPSCSKGRRMLTSAPASRAPGQAAKQERRVGVLLLDASGSDAVADRPHHRLQQFDDHNRGDRRANDTYGFALAAHPGRPVTPAGSRPIGQGSACPTYVLPEPLSRNAPNLGRPRTDRATAPASILMPVHHAMGRDPRLPAHERQRRPSERQVSRCAARRPGDHPRHQRKTRRRIVAHGRNLRPGQGQRACVAAHRE